MIDDLEAHGAGSRFEADVCIVGAGAAGIALAGALASPRRSVLVLESGGLRPEAATQALSEGETDGLGPGALTEGRGRAFGGTTTLWAGQCLPLDDIDFEDRGWVADSGWPIGPDDVRPFYGPAAELLGVPGEAYDESLWTRWGARPPAADTGLLRHTYTAWSPVPDLGRVTRRRFERSRDVRVLLHASVTSIATDEDGDGLGMITIARRDGRTSTVSARTAVLCCGGIENARLLLVGENPDAGGLGNAHDNVGRYFQDHVNARPAVVRTAAPVALQEAYSLFYRRGRRFLPKLELAPERQRAEGVLNCAANLEYEFADEGMNALRRVYRGARSRSERVRRADVAAAIGALPTASEAAYRRFVRGRATRAVPSRIWLQTHAEQAPNRESRVVLTREKDRLGVPKVGVQWRLTDLERRTHDVMTRTIATEFSRLGLGSVEPEGWLADPDGNWRERVNDSYHHAGTTRMSLRPQDGVVDENCRVHGVRGLFVAGGSVFPTSGYANPTLAIVALALRLAEHLRAELP